MSTKNPRNIFKFTESAVAKRCVPPREDELNAHGKPVLERRYWDTEIKGFGIGARRRTLSFILQRDLNGRSVKVTIGRYGPWTVSKARQRAREHSVEIDRGVNPNEEKKKARASGITLRDALTMHAHDMRTRDCAPLSMDFVEREVPRYLPDWADRPLANLTKLDCRRRHEKITSDRGPVIANRIMKSVAAAYRTAARVYDHLAEAPPTSAVRFNPTRRRRAPIPWDELPAWWAKVESIPNPIRRDLQLFLLFTGLRSADGKSIRWEHIDFVRRTLHRPKPKGGVDRAFTIPISDFVLELLRHRRVENYVLFPDSPWVFPTRRRDGSLSHVREVKELRNVDGGKRKITFVPSPHRLRDTFLTAAHECYLRELDIKVLANHALPGGDVTQGYIRPSNEHLGECVEKVSTFLLGKADAQQYSPPRAHARNSVG